MQALKSSIVGHAFFLNWPPVGRRTGATGNVTGLELAEVEFVASDAEVFDDVRNDAAWHIAGMPGKGDEPVGAERIGVVRVAAELLTRCMSLERRGICRSPFPSRVSHSPSPRPSPLRRGRNICRTATNRGV